MKKKFSKLHEEEIKSATDRKEREAAVVVKEKKLEEEVKKMKDLNEHTSEKVWKILYFLRNITHITDSTECRRKIFLNNKEHSHKV